MSKKYGFICECEACFLGLAPQKIEVTDKNQQNDQTCMKFELDKNNLITFCGLILLFAPSHASIITMFVLGSSNFLSLYRVNTINRVIFTLLSWSSESEGRAHDSIEPKSQTKEVINPFFLISQILNSFEQKLQKVLTLLTISEKRQTGDLNSVWWSFPTEIC